MTRHNKGDTPLLFPLQPLCSPPCGILSSPLRFLNAVLLAAWVVGINLLLRYFFDAFYSCRPTICHFPPRTYNILSPLGGSREPYSTTLSPPALGRILCSLFPTYFWLEIRVYRPTTPLHTTTTAGSRPERHSPSASTTTTLCPEKNMGAKTREMVDRLVPP